MDNYTNKNIINITRYVGRTLTGHADNNINNNKTKIIELYHRLCQYHHQQNKSSRMIAFRNPKHGCDVRCTYIPTR